MDIARTLKHLFYADWMVRRAFPKAAQEAIADAVQVAEHAYAGEIRFAIEGGLGGLALWRGQTPRERAIEVFSQLRVWDTEHNNGVLVYVLLADQAVEIVADRGIHARAGVHTWNAICHQMQMAFSKGDFRSGAILGVEVLSQALRKYFPKHAEREDELPNAPAMLD
jgi:hypothetical protein